LLQSKGNLSLGFNLTPRGSLALNQLPARQPRMCPVARHCTSGYDTLYPAKVKNGNVILHITACTSGN